MNQTEEHILENKTLCDESVIREMSKPLNTRYYKYIAAFDIVVLLLSQIPMLAGQYLAGCCGIGVVILFSIIAFYKGKNVVRDAMKLVRERYGADYYEASASIDSEKIIYKTPSFEQELYHNDIQKIRETDSLIVVEYKKKGMIPLAKNGFVKGSAEEFRMMIS